ASPGPRAVRRGCGERESGPRHYGAELRSSSRATRPANIAARIGATAPMGFAPSVGLDLDPPVRAPRMIGCDAALRVGDRDRFGIDAWSQGVSDLPRPRAQSLPRPLIPPIPVQPLDRRRSDLTDIAHRPRS